MFVVFMMGMMAYLGAWTARLQRRDPWEGFVLGVLLGPIGAVVEVLLPDGTRRSSAGKIPADARDIEKVSVITALADRFRSTLHEADPNWETLPYPRKRCLLKSAEKRLRRE
jgi:hypothetical protein